jgi:hypothetical protein
MCRPPKIGHTKKPLKSPKIMQNYLTSTLKNLQHTVFLDTPKWLFISGPDQLAHAKKREKQHQIKEVYLAPYKLM